MAVGPTLDVYRLVRPIGEGAQGTVWEAVHRYRDATVAIKVLRPDVAPHFQRLEQEAEALARLAHPSVIAVLDVGQVTPPEAGDTLAAGAPWLAMELVRGARPLGPARDWREALSALLALLDALAHCHARDVVHRDLKPGNVLTREGRVCLTDFGLAWLGADADARLRAGTPPYMAPEQFLGRPTGPAADLYALGCIAAYLVQGRPPFRADSLAELRDQHLYQLPELDPLIAVPPGFHGWIDGLLAKSADNRFRSAAHAADALAALGPAAAGPSRPSQPSIDTLTWVTDLPHSVVLDPARSQVGRMSLDRRTLRPVPKTWRTPYPVALDDIHTSGFGLHSLRDPPLIGRETERDQLWAALADVATTGHGRVLYLVGPPGSGRRYLARWTATRAAELAVATHRGPIDGAGPHVRVLATAPAEVPDGLLALIPADTAPPGAEVVTVGRMVEGEIRRLLDHRVRLDPMLTARLAWEADGHPGKAVQLLAQVVPLLRQGPDGPNLPPEHPPPSALVRPEDRADWGGRPVHRHADPPRPDHPDLLLRARAVEADDPDGAEALLREAMARPHLPLRLPAETVGTVDAVRAFAARQRRATTDPLYTRADLLEAWMLVNLHLDQRGTAIARAMLANPDLPPTVHRDAHLILAKSLRGQPAERRLPHIMAALSFPPHASISFRLRQWRSLLFALRELDARHEIDGLLERIAADPDLTVWSRVERLHEARRRGEPVDALEPVLAACQASGEEELIKAAAGLAFAMGRHPEGEALLRGLIEAGTDSAVLRCNLGWIIASQGRLDEVPPLLTTITEADADVMSSVSLLKAFVHADDPQLDVEAYLDRFRPFLIGEAFAAQTRRLLEDLAQRAEAVGLHARAVLARRHAAWLQQRSERSASAAII